MKKHDIFYSILFVFIFLSLLTNIEGSKKDKLRQPKSTIGCYHAPIYVYDEERKKFYRQDWCEYSTEPVYYDFIPVKNGDRRM